MFIVAFLWSVTAGANDLLTAIEHQESSAWPASQRDALIGDHGQALGRYQFHAQAWQDVSFYRKSHHEPVYGYRAGAHNGRVARLYAIDYVRILEERFKRRTRHVVRGPEDVLRAWKGVWP